MDITAVGELLIDFTPSGNGTGQTFIANPGGAPCNLLTMASHSGSKTAFIGKVGNDGFGRFLKRTIEKEGIDTSGLVLSDQMNTTLAFVQLDETGERSFSFYRKGCADINLEEDEVDLERIKETQILHFGSLSFTDEPSRSTVLHMLVYAKEQGVWISYDPNYRPSLWASEEEAKHWMLQGLQYADFLKVSIEEMELLTGEEDPKNGCKLLSSHGVRCIFVTLGQDGCFYSTPIGEGYIPGFFSQPVDTTGAGDTFFGALLSRFLASGLDPSHPDPKELEEILRYANAAAALCVEGFGGIPSIPSHDEVGIKIKRVE